MSELDTVAAELAAARTELREVLTMCGEYVRARSGDDRVAGFLAERLDSATDRVRCANVLGATAVQEGGGRG